VLDVLACVLAGAPLPFSPVQIIVLELFMDLAASTSFVAEPPEADLLRRPPRRREESFMNRPMLTGVFSGGAALAAAVLAAFLPGLRLGEDEARTCAFVAWLAGHVCLAFAMRTSSAPLRRSELLSSRPFDLWVAGVALFLALALSVPTLRDYLKLAPVAPARVLLAAAGAALAVSWIEVAKRIRYRRPAAGH